jgi:hypothetical protein
MPIQRAISAGRDSAVIFRSHRAKNNSRAVELAVNLINDQCPHGLQQNAVEAFNYELAGRARAKVAPNGSIVIEVMTDARAHEHKTSVKGWKFIDVSPALCR